MKNLLAMSARRGFTLVELVVTMALVVTISATAIGIVVITSKTVGTGENLYARITELRNTKTAVILWATSFDDAENTLVVENNRLSVKNSKGEEVAFLAIDGGRLYLAKNISAGDSLDGEDVQSNEMGETKFTVIKSASFELLNKIQSDEGGENNDNNDNSEIDDDGESFDAGENDEIPTDTNSKPDVSGNLIKCTITYTYENGEDIYTFVFVLRAAECIAETSDG
jgi:prepilin-type N-terminal cleavage/methylation domain-containing protein